MEGIWLQGRWYCSLECFERDLSSYIGKVLVPCTQSCNPPNQIPLGLLMLSQGLITEDQLREALDRQRSANRGRIGEWLVRLGAVEEPEVTAALARQQGCPILTIPPEHCMPSQVLLPDALVRICRGMPVLYRPGKSELYVGFVDSVKYDLLLALERTSECEARPCIISTSLFENCLKNQGSRLGCDTVQVEQHQDCRQIQQMVYDYVVQVGANRCSINLVDQYLWARMNRDDSPILDLLFRRPSVESGAIWEAQA